MVGFDAYATSRHLARRVGGVPVGVVERVGHRVHFAGQALGSIPHAVRVYRRQSAAVLSDLMWGSGGVTVGGGTVAVLVVLGLSVGGSIGIQGFATLNLFGIGPLTGFLSAYANTREIGPIVVAIGFAAQAGCRMTAEIGAMRISEEIDALEAQAIRPIPFVVSTRVVAGVITIIPLFLITLILSYLSCAFVVNTLHDQSSGTYHHYFNAFLAPTDVALSVLKAVVFVIAVILIHCYQGFYASGGPEGVGIASGRAIKQSFVSIVVLDMILTLLFWGSDVGFRFSG
ncbi:ABC transporter permease [Williamsia sp. CHRR-6]|uniref:ABC transporter permease n=1 Tax=Williamsia sp. CHRR-6 TaxID=2835871 RepID=UPI001BD9C218|nr:ABC transporter permease [Williamsia sp. CHRR-6]MBT0566571.1 ABC transporter permease [Williamsia sp. CHRR-6]